MIQLITEYKKDLNTNRFVQVKTESNELNDYQYKITVSNDSINFFRGLGGAKEVIKRNKDGKVIKITSISPNKEIKVIREFCAKEN